MLYRLRLISQVDAGIRIGHLDNLHCELITGNGDPVSVWGELDISDWQCAADKEFLEGVCDHRIHANSAIFGAGDEEVFLERLLVSNYPIFPYMLTAAVTPRFCS